MEIGRVEFGDGSNSNSSLISLWLVSLHLLQAQQDSKISLLCLLTQELILLRPYLEVLERCRGASGMKASGYNTQVDLGPQLHVFRSPMPALTEQRFLGQVLSLGF